MDVVIPRQRTAGLAGLREEIGRWKRREPPYNRPDAIDRILDQAFPQPVDPVKAKVFAHLERAHTASLDSIGTSQAQERLAAFRALEALAEDLDLI